MTERDECDHRILEAIAHIGPMTPHALAFHPIERRFATFDELDERLGELVEAGHLWPRTVVDVFGAPVTEYEINGD